MMPHEATHKLFDATKSGRLNDAEAAIAAGADTNTRATSQQTPLHWAAANGYTAIARLMIAKGADTNARDQAGNAGRLAKRRGKNDGPHG